MNDVFGSRLVDILLFPKVATVTEKRAANSTNVSVLIFKLLQKHISLIS